MKLRLQPDRRLLAWAALIGIATLVLPGCQQPGATSDAGQAAGAAGASGTISATRTNSERIQAIQNNPRMPEAARVAAIAQIRNGEASSRKINAPENKP